MLADAQESSLVRRMLRAEVSETTESKSASERPCIALERGRCWAAIARGSGLLYMRTETDFDLQDRMPQCRFDMAI